METNWTAITDDLMRELASADAAFRPTNYWTPGVQRLLDDLSTLGIANFKRWPQASGWFYPRYGCGYSYDQMDRMFDAIEQPRRAARGWLRTRLSGGIDARRDFDVASVAWDQERWPFDLTSHGESEVGNRPGGFQITGQEGVRLGRAYLNYLTCLAALSGVVDHPPSRFLEIGGGFGVLGEILLSRDPDCIYVDVDLPPLLSVASYYLSELFGNVTGPVGLRDGALAFCGTGVVPTWRLPDIKGPFDVFVNSFSFQEMEPHVVDNYVDLVVGVGVRWVVSLNSREGKRVADSSGPGGVVEQVTSQHVVDSFARHGFQPAARWGRPLIAGAGELVILQGV